MRSIVAQWSDRPGRDVFGHRQGTCLMGAVDVAGEWLGGGIWCSLFGGRSVLVYGRRTCALPLETHLCGGARDAAEAAVGVSQ